MKFEQYVTLIKARDAAWLLESHLKDLIPASGDPYEMRENLVEIEELLSWLDRLLKLEKPTYAHADLARPEEIPCEGCSHLHFVRAADCGSSSSGWGCRLSGGHAIKRCSGYTTIANVH